MNEHSRRRLGWTLAAAVFLLNYSPWVRAEAYGRDAAAAAAQIPERVLIPGGQAVGVALKTQGVLVVARPQKEGAASSLRVGDLILSVEGREIDGVRALSEQVHAADSDYIELGVLRRGRHMTVTAAATADSDGMRRLGVWVRDSTAGVGTLSYVDPLTGAYGALGHAIVDGDTGDMVVVREGAILKADVVGVARGSSGRAGELRGSFLKENEQIGTLKINSVYGIYGTMEETAQNALYPAGLPIASRGEVHPGPATILTTVDESGMQEYGIEILKCVRQDMPAQKGMTLRVTDARLIDKTGGIVQGMSGSPIIQDGKIVGAVTHVYLNDASQGYGMYIEWMLEQSDRIEAADAAA